MTQFLSARAARMTAVAIGSAAVMGIGAGAASATTVLGNGAALPAGTSIGGPLSGNATLNVTPAPQSATCTAGNFAGTIGTNPLSPSVSLTPTAFNLSSCTDTIAGYNITSAALVVSPAPAANVTTNAGLTGGTLNVVSPTVRVNVVAGGLPGVCNFTINNATTTASATATNNAVGTPSVVQFTAVPVTTASGVCASSAPATFTARFSPITVLSGALAGQKVTLG